MQTFSKCIDFCLDFKQNVLEVQYNRMHDSFKK